MSKKIIRELNAMIVSQRCRIECLEQAQNRQAELLWNEWENVYSEKTKESEYIVQRRTGKRESRDGGKTWCII